MHCAIASVVSTSLSPLNLELRSVELRRVELSCCCCFVAVLAGRLLSQEDCCWPRTVVCAVGALFSRDLSRATGSCLPFGRAKINLDS